jgi:hypothetical protein
MFQLPARWIIGSGSKRNPLFFFVFCVVLSIVAGCNSPVATREGAGKVALSGQIMCDAALETYAKLAAVEQEQKRLGDEISVITMGAATGTAGTTRPGSDTIAIPDGPSIPARRQLEPRI